MASIQSRVLIGMLRHRHLLKGKIRKETQQKSVEAVLKFRESCEKGASRFGKLAEGVYTDQELINMVLTEWIVPENALKDKLIFYVHGGGYVSGSCNDHRAIVSKIAKKTGVTTVMFEYGLAPENPFPAALNDSLNVYREILERGYAPENILMMGESAGGGLCLALLLALKDKKIPLPKAAVAIQPWTDLSCSGESYNTKNAGSLAPFNCWNVFSHYYVAGNDVTNPYISPLYGDLEGLPPLFINVGDRDELYDDGLLFYKKAMRSGVDVSLRIGVGMIHCYPLLDPFFPEATEAMNEIVMFVKEKLQ